LKFMKAVIVGALNGARWRKLHVLVVFDCLLLVSKLLILE